MSSAKKYRIKIAFITYFIMWMCIGLLIHFNTNTVLPLGIIELIMVLFGLVGFLLFMAFKVR